MKMFILSTAGALLLAVSLAAPAAGQADRKPPGKPAGKTALDHLRAARTSLDEVKPQSLTAAAAAKVRDIGQRLVALEQSYASHGKKTMSTQETPSGGTRVRIGREGTWSSQVPEIDRRLGELIDAKAPIARQQEGADALRRKLIDVRAHVTAFAKAATGTSGPPR